VALSKTDGRLGRSERSRAAVAEALLALIEEGDLRPTAPRIAARAGVSLRLVFHHFKDLEAVLTDAAKRQLERIIPTLRPVSSEGPLPKRIEAFVAERTRLLERVLTMWRAAELQEPFSTEISRRMTMIRTWLRTELERVFAAELTRLKAAERQELVAGLGAVGGMAMWVDLRQHQGLGTDRARKVMARALAQMLRR
jgi:TetR/AcrR family transcriptional regulator, regulator of autoinduction and epiphytic fitness